MSSSAWVTRRAERLGDRLVAEADAEERAVPRRAPRARRRSSTPAAAGVPGPGESSTASYSAMHGGARHPREGVVAHDLGLGAELQQVAVERVDEAVVVVDDEDAGHRRHPRSTSGGVTSGCDHGNTQSTSAARTAAAATSRMSDPQPPRTGQHTPERGVHQPSAERWPTSVGRGDIAAISAGGPPARGYERVEHAVRDDALGRGDSGLQLVSVMRRSGGASRRHVRHRLRAPRPRWACTYSRLRNT